LPKTRCHIFHLRRRTKQPSYYLAKRLIFRAVFVRASVFNDGLHMNIALL